MQRQIMKLDSFFVGFLISIMAIMISAVASADWADDVKKELLKNQPNLNIQSIIMVDGDLAYLGHPITFKVALGSDQEVKDVGISFYLMNKDDETNQFHLGSTLIPFLGLDENEFQLSFYLPSNTNYVGEYNIIGYIDPLDLFPEPNEDDNIYCSDAYTVHLSDKNIEKPDLVIIANELDSEIVVLSDESNEALEAFSESDFPDLCDAQIKATLEVLSGGKTTTNVPVSFCLQLPDGTCLPLMVWDSSQMAYVGYLTIPELTTNTPLSIPIELLILPEQIPTIQNYLSQGQNFMMVKAEIGPFDQFEEFEDSVIEFGENDNVMLREVLVFQDLDTENAYASSSGPLKFEKSYSKGFSNYWFGAKIEVKGEAGLDKNGAMAKASGKAPVTVIGYTFDFMNAEATAQATPQNMAASYFSIDVKFAGQSIYSHRKDGKFSWEKKPSWKKEKGYKEWVNVGPIPVSLEAGASGELGFKVNVAVQENFSASLDPYVDTGAYAKAAVDIVVASAGVKGSLSLIKDTLDTSTTCSMTLKEGGSVLEGTLHEKITNEINGPSGKISLFVKWTSGIKWCKKCKWHVCIWYPCGKKTHEADKSLVSWSSFKKQETLLDKKQTTSIDL